MKVGDLVYTKRSIVLSFPDAQGEVVIDAGVLGQITYKQRSHDVFQNACSVPRFDVKIQIVPMVSVTVSLREDDLVSAKEREK